MVSYQHLIGMPYVEGRQDCYGLIRTYYADVFSIDLPNYARPTDWSGKADLDLLGRLYHDAGFEVLDVHPSEWRPGDVFLIGVRNTHSNHAAVLVENGLILHHLFRSLSRTDRYAGLWRNCTLAVLRHRSHPYREEASTVDLMSLLPPRLRKKLEDAASPVPHAG